MAAENETPFTTLLRADSEHALPDDDGEVIAALVKYGVVFDKRKLPRSSAEARLNLLAGVLWLHLHLNDLPEAWPALSVAQQRILAILPVLGCGQRRRRAVLVRLNQAPRPGQNIAG